MYESKHSLPWVRCALAMFDYCHAILYRKNVKQKPPLIIPKERQLSKYTIIDPLNGKICLVVFGGLPYITAQSATHCWIYSLFPFYRRSLWAYFLWLFPTDWCIVLICLKCKPSFFNFLYYNNYHMIIIRNDITQFDWPWNIRGGQMMMNQSQLNPISCQVAK